MAIHSAPTADIGSPDISWGTQGQGLQAEWWCQSHLRNSSGFDMAPVSLDIRPYET